MWAWLCNKSFRLCDWSMGSASPMHIPLWAPWLDYEPCQSLSYSSMSRSSSSRAPEVEGWGWLSGSRTSMEGSSCSPAPSRTLLKGGLTVEETGPSSSLSSCSSPGSLSVSASRRSLTEEADGYQIIIIIIIRLDGVWGGPTFQTPCGGGGVPHPPGRRSELRRRRNASITDHKATTILPLPLMMHVDIWTT